MARPVPAPATCLRRTSWLRLRRLWPDVPANLSCSWLAIETWSCRSVRRQCALERRVHALWIGAIPCLLGPPCWRPCSCSRLHDLRVLADACRQRTCPAWACQLLAEAHRLPLRLCGALLVTGAWELQEQLRQGISWGIRGRSQQCNSALKSNQISVFCGGQQCVRNLHVLRLPAIVFS